MLEMLEINEAESFHIHILENSKDTVVTLMCSLFIVDI